MALRFQALLKTYDLLAELILYTIRIDVRCRTMYHLELTLREVGVAVCGPLGVIFS
jgi:exocyst complex component 4